MGRTTRTRKRSTIANRAIVATTALLLGGGGLVALDYSASAGEGTPQRPRSAAQALSTIDCPDVGNALPDVPASARPAVDRELAAMDSQITDAYRVFADRRADIESDPARAGGLVLDPLKDKRTESLGRIDTALEQGGGQDSGLKGFAACTLRADDDGAALRDPGRKPGQKPGQGTGSGQQPGRPPSGNGPERSDFAAITSVRPNAKAPRPGRNASRGTFTSDCGRNKNGKFNPDNVIVAPGVSNGAHHMHDYIGNQATDAFATDEDLASGATTCRNQGDRSTYYWPVLRLQNGRDEDDAGADGGGKDRNTGEIQTPAQVTLTFAGSPVSKVTAMPRFLRIITGDAKAFTNGDANANASWSCTGFENRQLKDKYPICPRGSKVVRTFRFQSCWDGANTDSANHRTHVAFAGRDGRCGQGFKAIPQLVQRIVYAVPPGPGFAVDSFPEQLHKPVTDHGDFINVFDEKLMARVVSCLNTGRSCR
ncbi:DUF1996 domain-containing protein [Streptomyces sp. NPDC001941]|uniref:DUF1996 domain-containing protein n=1 Tax=Streptomyces sp. NPDC001941 TaxID=3154659 RepID=UPI00331B73BB